MYQKSVANSKLFNGYSVLSGFDLFSSFSTLPTFTAKFPWYGGDLQTISSQFRADLTKNLSSGTKILLPLSGNAHEKASEKASEKGSDKGSENDNALSARCNISNLEGKGGKPAIIMLHGLGGDEDSIYMREAAQFFNSKGHTVVRLNLRGVGASARTSQNIYHAGISDDLRNVISLLPKYLKQNGVFILGFSLGANVLLKYMGEGEVPNFVKGAVSVSAPIDLKVTQRRIAEFRNRIYRIYLLKKLKKDFAQINWSAGKAPLQKIEKLSSIIEFDDQVIAPIYGFDNAYDYYEKCSSKPFINNISKPTLIIHAKTDPWILADQFRDINWLQNQQVCTIICKDGGHVGFNDKNHKFPWHLHAARAFFQTLI